MEGGGAERDGRGRRLLWDREVQRPSLQEWGQSGPQASRVPPCERDKGLEAQMWGMLSRLGCHGSAGELKPLLL